MECLTLLGVTVCPIDIESLNEYINQSIVRMERRIIANHNLHSVYLYHSDPKMSAFYKKAEITHIDGMPLVYWACMLGYSVTSQQRVTYVDWVQPLMAMAASNGWRVFYLGGKPGVALKAAERLRERYPGLNIATRHGYFGPEENDEVLEEIATFHPHVLMVGMGMPRQEHWILDNMERIQANAILTAGACFDYLAGVVPTPPRWMGRLGLEWLFRFLSEPRRLFFRYFIEPWFLLPYAISDLRKVWFGKRRN
ncbi:MAG: WecB/TagA/CpsF family glycosyltransferase [Anaerolineales bacterium]